MPVRSCGIGHLCCCCRFAVVPAGGLLERAEEKGLSDRYSWDDWLGMLRAVPERF